MPVRDTDARREEVRALAAAGRDEASIARTLRMDRKHLRGLLRRLASEGYLRLVEGGGRGRPKRYEPGPLPGPVVHKIADLISNRGVHELPLESSPPPPPLPLQPASTFLHHIGYLMPVFEDELWYHDPVTKRRSNRRWTVGSWEGDILARWETRGGTKHYVFREQHGGWRLILWSKPRRVRAVAHKGRAAWHVRVGSVWLTPTPLAIDDAQHLRLAPELEFSAVLVLLKDIRDNRGLFLEGIPERRNIAEFADEFDGDESIPEGRTEIGPGIWVDHSPKCARCRSKLPKGTLTCPVCGYTSTRTEARRPELETNEPGQAARNRLGLQLLREVPDLTERLGRWEEELTRMKRDTEDMRRDIVEILRLLRERP